MVAGHQVRVSAKVKGKYQIKSKQKLDPLTDLQDLDGDNIINGDAESQTVIAGRSVIMVMVKVIRTVF